MSDSIFSLCHGRYSDVLIYTVVNYKLVIDEIAGHQFDAEQMA